MALDAVFVPDAPPVIPGMSQTADGQHKRSRTELLDAIRSLAKQLDSVPTSTDMNEQGRVSYKAIYEQFGSWDSALLAAGLRPSNTAIDLSNPVTALVDEVDGFGESAARSLENAGYETVRDLYKATKAELLDVDRIGPTMAEKLLSYPKW
jgi:hypothetical protein